MYYWLQIHSWIHSVNGDTRWTSLSDTQSFFSLHTQQLEHEMYTSNAFPTEGILFSIIKSSYESWAFFPQFYVLCIYILFSFYTNAFFIKMYSAHRLRFVNLRQYHFRICNKPQKALKIVACKGETLEICQ